MSATLNIPVRSDPRIKGSRARCCAFIEATGQKVLGASDFPFPSLLGQGVKQDLVSDGATEVERGIATDGHYHWHADEVSPDSSPWCHVTPTPGEVGPRGVFFRPAIAR